MLTNKWTDSCPLPLNLPDQVKRPSQSVRKLWWGIPASCPALLPWKSLSRPADGLPRASRPCLDFPVHQRPAAGLCRTPLRPAGLPRVSTPYLDFPAHWRPAVRLPRACLRPAGLSRALTTYFWTSPRIYALPGLPHTLRYCCWTSPRIYARLVWIWTFVKKSKSLSRLWFYDHPWVTFINSFWS